MISASEKSLLPIRKYTQLPPTHPQRRHSFRPTKETLSRDKSHWGQQRPRKHFNFRNVNSLISLEGIEPTKDDFSESIRVWFQTKIVDLANRHLWENTPTISSAFIRENWLFNHWRHQHNSLGNWCNLKLKINDKNLPELKIFSRAGDFFMLLSKQFSTNNGGSLFRRLRVSEERHFSGFF